MGKKVKPGLYGPFNSAQFAADAEGYLPASRARFANDTDLLERFAASVGILYEEALSTLSSKGRTIARILEPDSRGYCVELMHFANEGEALDAVNIINEGGTAEPYRMTTLKGLKREEAQSFSNASLILSRD